MTTVLLVIMGVLIGLLFCGVVVMVLLPFFGGAGIFVNGPEGLEKSGFHIFTKLAPGQVKIIERGDKIVRMISDTAHKKFRRTGPSMNSPKYWEFEDSDKSDDPIADVWAPIRWWARLVYAQTGLIFTGIYPFQRVREYRLERTIIKRHEGSGNGSNLVLDVKDDISDHFRTRQFLFPMHITAAETRDKIPLDIIGVAEMEVVNPYKAAYGTDRWDHSVINLVTDTLTAKTRTMSLDEALTAKDEAGARIITDAVMHIKDDELVCGIQVTGFRILEINPVLDEAGKKTIQSEALAEQAAKATRIDGKARADALRAINEANKEGGDSSLASMQAEALVRAVEAASKGGGTVFLNQGGGGNDSVQAAILAELKKLNERK